MPNFDDLCSYSTLRTVYIRDWRLGLLYYSVLVIIAGYVVGFNVVFLQLYRRTDSGLVGTARIQVRSPDAEYSIPAPNTSFCGSGPGVPYKGVGGVPFLRYPCRYWDSFDSVFPAVEQSSAFLTTRVTETLQWLPPGCLDQATNDCQFADDNASSSTFYVADVEFATILIDHLITAPRLALSLTAQAMPGGRLLDRAGRPIDPCADYVASTLPCPATVGVGGGAPDVVPLAALLRAAGVGSLDRRAAANDDIAADDGGGLGNSTLRQAGVVLVIKVEYWNDFRHTGSWSERDVQYIYTVEAVADAEFKAEQVVYPTPLNSQRDPTNITGDGGGGGGSAYDDRSERASWLGGGGRNRTIVDRHGVRLVVRQAGAVGGFDAAALLAALTAALGLTAAAAAALDWVAAAALPPPHGAVYRRYMRVDTPDLGRLGQMPADLLERFSREDLVNPVPPIFAAAAAAAAASAAAAAAAATEAAVALTVKEEAEHLAGISVAAADWQGAVRAAGAVATAGGGREGGGGGGDNGGGDRGVTDSGTGGLDEPLLRTAPARGVRAHGLTPCRVLQS